MSSLMMVRRRSLVRAIVRISQSHSRSLSSSVDPSPEPRGVDPTMVMETLSSYCNDWRRALEFFRWVEESPEIPFSHTTETYNKIIDILGKFFEFDRCWDLIRRMNRENSGSHPNHATFRVMFNRFVSAHSVKDAVDAYNRSAEFGLKDQTSFENLVDALCEHKHVIEAQDLCLWSHDEKQSTKKQSMKKQSTKICNMILRGFSRIGWYGKCKEVWEEMEARGIEKNLYTYSIYMDIQCKNRKPWKAVTLFREMKKNRKIKPDVVAYNTAIRAVGLTDGVDFSLRLLREMSEPNSASYNTVVKLLCEGGRFEDARRVLDEMRKRGKGCEPDVITYHCFFGSMRKPDEMLELLDGMIGAGVKPRIDTFVMLMRRFRRWGFLRPVMMAWDKMGEIGLSPNDAAYNVLIDALVDKGMVDLARKYDEEMLAKGLSPRPRAGLGSKRPDDDDDDD